MCGRIEVITVFKGTGWPSRSGHSFMSNTFAVRTFWSEPRPTAMVALLLLHISGVQEKKALDTFYVARTEILLSGW